MDSPILYSTICNTSLSTALLQTHLGQLNRTKLMFKRDVHIARSLDSEEVTLNCFRGDIMETLQHTSKLVFLCCVLMFLI